MTQQQEQLSALQEIRSIMDRSTRFISLSGLSGIFIGIFALAGAGTVEWYLNKQNLVYRDVYNGAMNTEVAMLMMTIAAAVFLLAVASVIFFSSRRGQKMKQSLWHRQGQRLVVSLCIPLAAGGFFCLILLYHSLVFLMVPAMLIFYGLSLINSSKYTFKDIRYLGFCEILLGLSCGFLIDYGLLFWALGFGVLHLAYGLMVYYKYERAE